MSDLDPRQEALAAVVRRISDLNEQSLLQLSQYISYLKWQEELWHSLLDDESDEPGGDQELIWKFDFLEGFSSARQAATRTPELMEIKVGVATSGMVQKLAL